MAKKGKKAKSLKGDRFLAYKKLLAGVSLLAFLVITIQGLKADVRLTIIAWRATKAMLVLFVLGRIIIKVLASYEEMNSGKA